MPFVKANVKREIEEKRENDPEFKKAWDESREEYEKLKEEVFGQKTEEELSEFDKFLLEQLKDPELKREWDALQPEFEAIRAEMESRKTETTGFFDETMQSLQEAVAIKRGEIPVEKVGGMPAPTYRAKSKEK